LKIIIGSDHAGFSLKEALKGSFGGMVDAGTYNEDSVDYPDFAARVARAISSGEFERGSSDLRLRSGHVNSSKQIPGVRAALCTDTDTARHEQDA